MVKVIVKVEFKVKEQVTVNVQETVKVAAGIKETENWRKVQER